MPRPASKPIVEAQKTPKFVYELSPRVNELGKRFEIKKYITAIIIADEPNSPIFNAFCGLPPSLTETRNVPIIETIIPEDAITNGNITNEASNDPKDKSKHLS